MGRMSRDISQLFSSSITLCKEANLSASERLCNSFKTLQRILYSIVMLNYNHSAVIKKLCRFVYEIANQFSSIRDIRRINEYEVELFPAFLEPFERPFIMSAD